MKKFLRVLRRLVLGLAFLATLAVLALVVDDWIGRREFRRALAPYDLAAPPPGPAMPAPPDETNFAAAPMVRALVFADSLDPAVLSRLRSAAAEKDLFFVLHSDWLHGRPVSLREACRVARRALPETADERDAARLILNELEPARAELDALATAAATRPNVAIDPTKAAELRWIPFKNVRDLCHALSLRAAARLQLGRSDEAFGDCLAIMRLSQIYGASPGLVHQVMKYGVFLHYALPIFWEGWSRAQWTNAQYQMFSRCFALGENRHLLPGLVRSEQGGFFSQLLASLPIVSKQGPRGWIARKLARVLDANREVAAAISFSGDRIDASRVSNASALITGSLGTWSLVNWESVLSHASFIESMLDLGQVVCALESHRLRTGSYPADLTKISAGLPGGIPRDFFSGEPPRYHREPEGTAFSLYLDGWNQRDDQGLQAEWTYHDLNIMLKTGDWIWPQPARD